MSAKKADIHLIATRYAHALFLLTEEKKRTDEAAKDLTAFGNMLAASEQLQRFLANPTVSRADSAKAVESLLASLKASELTRKFFGLLAESRRLNMAKDIIDAFLVEVAKAHGEIHAQVVAATALSEMQLGEISDALAKATGKEANINLTVNKGILGGLIVRIGGLMIDGSIKGKLERLRLSLTQ